VSCTRGTMSIDTWVLFTADTMVPGFHAVWFIDRCPVIISRQHDHVRRARLLPSHIRPSITLWFFSHRATPQPRTERTQWPRFRRTSVGAPSTPRNRRYSLYVAPSTTFSGIMPHRFHMGGRTYGNNTTCLITSSPVNGSPFGRGLIYSHG